MDKLPILFAELRNRGAIFENDIFRDWLYNYACCVVLYTQKEVSQESLDGKMLEIAALIVNELPADVPFGMRKMFELRLTPRENLHFRLPPIQFDGYMDLPGKK